MLVVFMLLLLFGGMMLCIGRGVRGTARETNDLLLYQCDSEALYLDMSRYNAFAKLYRSRGSDILNPTWAATDRAGTRTWTCYSGNCDKLPPFRKCAADVCIRESRNFHDSIAILLSDSAAAGWTRPSMNLQRNLHYAFAFRIFSARS